MGVAAAHVVHLAGHQSLVDVDMSALRRRLAKNLGDA
jgi:hypothetical protein